MIPITSVPKNVAPWVIAIDPGANGGWALFGLTSAGYLLSTCGLCRPDLGERPPDIGHIEGQTICVLEVPQKQHKDTDKRINDLFKLTLRAGLLAESTHARYLYTRTPHSWKGSVPKDLHNSRCRERLFDTERELVQNCLRGDGRRVTASELNNVIDAVALGLTVLGRW